MKRIFLGIVVIGLLGMGCGRSNQEEAHEIKIGEYGSLTGSTATFGQSTHQGIELATSEINAADGLLGKKVKDKADVIVPAGKITFEIIEIGK